MANQQNKQWTGIMKMVQVPAILFLLYVLFAVVFDPSFHIFYVGNQNNFRRAACASNMKQLGLALVQYSQDYDNALPRYASADGYGWREAVYPYVKSTNVFRCPDDPRDASQATPENLPKSYAANIISLGKVEFSDPAKTISVADTRGYDGEEWNMVSPAFLPGTGRSLYAHQPLHAFYEHPDGVLNVLFADGHVKGMKAATTLTPTNLWTRDNAPFVGQDLVNAQAILKHAEEE